jgi:2,5-dihydroxypyridine 5,6-dioxygenase
MGTTVNLARMWKDMLDLCQVKATENVVVLNRQSGPSPYARVAVQAAEVAAASVSYIEVADPSAVPAPALAAIRKADLLLDLAFSHDEQVFKSLQDGLRILLTVEPPEILSRMFPTQADKQRCLAGQHRLGYANTMRVVSDAGTDFTVSLGEFPSRCQYGFADEPGRWDQWPGAFVYTYPNEASPNGTVVLDRGDILFPMKSYIQSEIRLTVKNGFITNIDGGFDAQYLSDIFKSYNDPDVYAISHLGWGLSHNGHWNILGMYDKADIEGQDGRAFYGNFLFSTGPNAHGGGKRNTPCHIDIPMRNCSLFLDTQSIVLNGEITPDDQRVVRGQIAAE